MEVHRDAVWALLSELWGVAQHVRRGTEAQPVDPVLVRLLAFVAQRGGARPGEIAEALGVTHPSVTRHVTALEDAGQVSAISDPDDGRSYRVHATAQGQAALVEFQDGLIERFAPALHGWNADETAQLVALLARLNGSMAAVDAQRRGKPRGRNRWRPSS